MLLIAAAFCFSLMSLQVKLAGRELPVAMLVLARGVVTLVMSFVWLRARAIPMWGERKRLLLLRGVFGLGGLACFFYAVTALPLAEVTVIHYLNPILTAGAAALILGERIDRRLVYAIAMSLAGTLIVVRPAFLFDYGPLHEGLLGEGFLRSAAPLAFDGVLAALGGALFSACAYTTVRKLAAVENPHVIVFYFPLVAVPATLPFAIRDWVWPSLTGWLLMLGLGVATQFAQILFTRGLAIVPAGKGTTVGYVQIVFAAAWGLWFFGDELSGWTIGGAVLVGAGTMLLFAHRRRPPVPPELDPEPAVRELDQDR